MLEIEMNMQNEKQIELEFPYYIFPRMTQEVL